ncbi:UPF0223 family protein [Alkalicoccus daliensis]|uniref:Uncharacterized protein YktA, UPF0223 family n=1 Tax=Alkalicoccus daliensis TaxID=745820 RepID=A0A1G9ZR20_9BACI|nr:UPF0223 family protein [Alkalicoccus daliensis]SDN23670.1 Uncharacterized protein YktA, UPF0223 family [Alkalicoccus daliensis]
MSKDIYFPISMNWSKEEVIDIVNFFEAVNKAYGKGVDRAVLLTLYNHFKKIVPSKSEEKQHFKEYQEQTGQSPYHVVKKAKEMEDGNILRM